MSTKCQHKRIHNGNWIAPDGQTLNQIGHVVVNKHGLRYDSDQFSVISFAKQKVIIQ
jgi:hypothetical protein